jgi:hypothetical protein
VYYACDKIFRIVEKKIVWLVAGHRRETRRLYLRLGRRTGESEKDRERNREEKRRGGCYA